jgi:hypothetical protein
VRSRDDLEGPSHAISIKTPKTQAEAAKSNNINPA